MGRHRERYTISEEDAVLFEKAQEQLQSFYREIGNISKKKPSEPLNKFKLGFINQSLGKANDLLSDDYRPFPDFTLFDVEGSLPSASDVVMMLDQYIQSMRKFESDHTYHGQWSYSKPSPDAEATDEEDDPESDDDDLDEEEVEDEEDVEDEEETD